MWAYVPLPTTSATRLAATATDADTVRTNVSSATTSNLDGFKPSTFMLAIVAGRLAPLSTLPDDQEAETEQPDRKKRALEAMEADDRAGRSWKWQTEAPSLHRFRESLAADLERAASWG